MLLDESILAINSRFENLMVEAVILLNCHFILESNVDFYVLNDMDITGEGR